MEAQSHCVIYCACAFAIAKFLIQLYIDGTKTMRRTEHFNFWSVPVNMLKLTQCIIVKNEEQNLQRALHWGKGVVDEQIVIDTGSDDGTVALAKQLGAKVLHFGWVDDFSAARNFAISQCTGDWIFFLDADEYFEDADIPLLRTLIGKVDGYSASVKGQRCLYNVIETPWINLGSDQAATQARIFRNVPYLRYAGAVHEQLHALPDGYLKVYRVKEKPAIYHTGYQWSGVNRKEAKGARNFEAARKALEKDPGCAKLQLFAAEALNAEGKYADANLYFMQAMQNTDGSIWAERAREGYKQWLSNYLAMSDAGAQPSDLLGPAARVYAQATAIFPDDPDFDVLISLLFFKANDILNTIRFFSASLSKNGGRISEGLMGSNREAFEQLRKACEKLKKENII